MNPRRRFIVIITERGLTNAICKSAPHIAWYGRRKVILSLKGGQIIFVWAEFCQCAVWNKWQAFIKNRCILSNLRGTISVFASFSFSNIDLSLVCFHVEYPVAKMIAIIENSYFTSYGNYPFWQYDRRVGIFKGKICATRKERRKSSPDYRVKSY